LAPAVREASAQLPAPAVSEAVQVAAPSLTVTEPVGVAPAPLTVYATVYDTPTAAGSGVSEPIAIVALALLTVCVALPLAAA
jgi:hypothetical protein